MKGYSLDLPQGYEEYASEVESKGWFSDATLAYSGRRYRLSFYDPVRLAQEIDSKMQRGRVFFETNLMVIRSVTRPNMENAVTQLVERGDVPSLITE